jgi:hypothetical protein
MTRFTFLVSEEGNAVAMVRGVEEHSCRVSCRRIVGARTFNECIQGNREKEGDVGVWNIPVFEIEGDEVELKRQCASFRRGICTGIHSLHCLDTIQSLPPSVLVLSVLASL